MSIENKRPNDGLESVDDQKRTEKADPAIEKRAADLRSELGKRTPDAPEAYNREIAGSALSRYCQAFTNEWKDKMDSELLETSGHKEAVNAIANEYNARLFAETMGKTPDEIDAGKIGELLGQFLESVWSVHGTEQKEKQLANNKGGKGTETPQDAGRESALKETFKAQKERLVAELEAIKKQEALQKTMRDARKMQEVDGFKEKAAAMNLQHPEAGTRIGG